MNSDYEVTRKLRRPSLHGPENCKNGKKRTWERDRTWRKIYLFFLSALNSLLIFVFSALLYHKHYTRRLISRADCLAFSHGRDARFSSDDIPHFCIWDCIAFFQQFADEAFFVWLIQKEGGMLLRGCGCL